MDLYSPIYCFVARKAKAGKAYLLFYDPSMHFSGVNLKSADDETQHNVAVV